MKIVISLIIVTLISMFFSEKIRKNSSKLYIIAAIVAIIGIGNNLLDIFGYDLKSFPQPWMSTMRYINHGILPTALFILVMYVGALSANNKYVANIMRIRGELSIIASILISEHVFVFTRGFIERFSMIFTMDAFKATRFLLVTGFGLLAFAVMVPLFITSFKKIRKGMNGKKWKKIQRYAYIFYASIYAHVIVLFAMGQKRAKHIPEIIIYTVIFVSYTVLRILKSKKGQYLIREDNKKAA